MAVLTIRLAIVMFALVAVLASFDIYRVVFGSSMSPDVRAVRVPVIGIRLLFLAPSVLVVFGLLRTAPWALRSAVAFSFCFAFLLGALPFLAMAALAISLGVDPAQLLPQGMYLVPTVGLGLAFLALAIALRSKSIELHLDR
jgi:hypothetical protein